jgi:hypothetical protein
MGLCVDFSQSPLNKPQVWLRVLQPPQQQLRVSAKGGEGRLQIVARCGDELLGESVQFGGGTRTRPCRREVRPQVSDLAAQRFELGTC